MRTLEQILELLGKSEWAPVINHGPKLGDGVKAECRLLIQHVGCNIRVDHVLREPVRPIHGRFIRQRQRGVAPRLAIDRVNGIHDLNACPTHEMPTPQGLNYRDPIRVGV